MPNAPQIPIQPPPSGQGARILDISARVAWREADAIWRRQSEHGKKRAA